MRYAIFTLAMSAAPAFAVCGPTADVGEMLLTDHGEVMALALAGSTTPGVSGYIVFSNADRSTYSIAEIRGDRLCIVDVGANFVADPTGAFARLGSF